jgi:cytosine/adenosine deaminase-related metal-dependent hydrolase
MIRLEQKLLPELQPYTQERAEKLIDLLQSKGTSIARSHCNIEPVSGLKNLENLQACWRVASRVLPVKLWHFHSMVCCYQNLNR